MITKNSSDRLQHVFLWVTFIVPIAFNIHGSFHPELDIERVLLGVVLFVLWLLISIIYGLLALRHNLSSKIMLFPILTFVVWIWLGPLLLCWFSIGDYIHLAAEYKNYKAKIEASPNTRLKFGWGGGGWSAGASFDRTLVYDPTDKLLQENKAKDAELQKRYHHISIGDGHEYFDQRLLTRCLIGHFYIVEARYQ